MVALSAVLVPPSTARAAGQFREGFNDGRLNTSLWTSETRRVSDVCSNEANAIEAGGYLQMTAEYVGGTCGYSGSRVTTKDKRYFGYGLLSARIKWNTEKGSWQNFGMFGKDLRPGAANAAGARGGLVKERVLARGEIDTEVRWENALGYVLHYALWSVKQADPAARCGIAVSMPFGGTSEWHVYGIDRQPTMVRFLVDGKHTMTITYAQMVAKGCTMPFNRTFNVVLSNRANGAFGGTTNPADFPTTTLVDYVRKYRPIL